MDSAEAEDAEKRSLDPGASQLVTPQMVAVPSVQTMPSLGLGAEGAGAGVDGGEAPGSAPTGPRVPGAEAASLDSRSQMRVAPTDVTDARSGVPAEFALSPSSAETPETGPASDPTSSLDQAGSLTARDETRRGLVLDAGPLMATVAHGAEGAIDRDLSATNRRAATGTLSPAQPAQTGDPSRGVADAVATETIVAEALAAEGSGEVASDETAATGGAPLDPEPPRQASNEDPAASPMEPLITGGTPSPRSTRHEASERQPEAPFAIEPALRARVSSAEGALKFRRSGGATSLPVADARQAAVAMLRAILATPDADPQGPGDQATAPERDVLSNSNPGDALLPFTAEAHVSSVRVRAAYQVPSAQEPPVWEAGLAAGRGVESWVTRRMESPDLGAGRDGGRQSPAGGQGAVAWHGLASDASLLAGLAAFGANGAFSVPDSTGPAGAAGTTALDPEAEAVLPRQIVQAIQLNWKANVGEARIQLKPEHLGEVGVTLKVVRDLVTATLHAETPAVRQWIESHQENLKSALAEQGLYLDRIVVTADGERSGREQPGQDEAAPRERRQAHPDPSTPRFEIHA